MHRSTQQIAQDLKNHTALQIGETREDFSGLQVRECVCVCGEIDVSVI